MLKIYFLLSKDLVSKNIQSDFDLYYYGQYSLSKSESEYSRGAAYAAWQPALPN